MVSLMAEYISGGPNRPVFIGNVSEEGIYMVTLSKGKESRFFPGKNVELKLRLALGESLPLRCEVRWVSAERPPYDVTYGVGLEIIDPSSQYVSFIKSL
jgi:hypothetical protein